MDAIKIQPLAAARWQRWFLAGLIVLFLGVGIQYTIKVSGANDHRSAFLRWRESLLHLERGVNLYEEYNYPNPPIMALLLRPLAELPPLAGSLLWFWLKVLMAFLIFHWVFRLVEEPGRPCPVWAKMLAVALSLRPIIGDLSHGNVNIFILFLVVGALLAYRQRHDLGCGLLLGLAIACKVTPALFVPYLLWKRAWTALAGCAVGLVLSLWLVPGGLLGFAHNQQLLNEWAEQMIVPYVLEGKVTTEHQNQSLPGLAYRLLTHGPSFSEWDEKTWGYVPVEFHNVLDLDPGIVALVLKVCMLIFAGLVVWSCRTPTDTRRSWRLAAEYTLIVLGMLLFSERTWKHHCVSLVLPFTLLMYCLAAFPQSRGRRLYLIGTLAAVTVVTAFTSSGLFGSDVDGLAKLAQVYGAHVWAHLALVAAVVGLLRWVARPESAKGVLKCQVATRPLGTQGGPHSRLLRACPEGPTVTATGTDVRQGGSADGQQTESVRDARDPRRGPEAHSRGVCRGRVD